MGERQGLVAEAAIDGEVADVGGDNFCFGVKFGQHHERDVAGVHLRIVAEKGRGASAVIGPDGQKIEAFFSDQPDEDEHRLAFSAQEMAGFSENHFGREHRFVERSDDACAPCVPLIANGKCADQRSGIDQISNYRSLHASRGRAVRF